MVKMIWRRRKENDELEVCFRAYPALTWKSAGSLATLSSEDTDKDGDLEPRGLLEEVTWEDPSLDTAWRSEEV